MKTTHRSQVTAIAVAMLLILSGYAVLGGAEGAKNSIFETSILYAKDAIAAGRLAEAEEHVERALLRDPKSAEAWALRAAWAEKSEKVDEQTYALHQEYRLRRAQKTPAASLKALAAKIVSLDPIAADYFKLRDKYLAELLKLAQGYEKEGRPHSAIRTYRQVLALEPEQVEAAASIERISAKPDPSLAETAKPKDLLADVSEEFVADHDAKHVEWKTRAKLERDNYVTQTNAGYEVMVRTGEAMEQMSRFYRRFFHYAEDVDKGGVPRIDVLIFKSRDEYLKLGSGPPVEWSGGQFTGGSVETYVGEGGFEEMVTTLFHEAAHQFVSLATSASGWLNEGLASFFEGTRILANGTVVMNMPANHRLFPLVTRMEKGWMKDHTDGIDPANASAEPTTAPTWQIILENKYAWGPPWYAPTWGVCFFLYNYQDPADGRFVYRAAFAEFINSSGGRTGEGAIRNFEDVVLANPSRPTKGYGDKSEIALPKTCEDLNEIWKQWLVALSKEQSGQSGEKKPWREWADCAVTRGEMDVATEHFEKGTLQSPDDVDLLEAFATHLLENVKNPDRASKVALHALVMLEREKTPDEKRIDDVEELLSRCDPKRSQAKRLRNDLAKAAEAIVTRYIDAKSPLLAMDVSSRLGTELGLPSLFDLFEKAARMTDRSIARWQLCYNEQDLRGWAGPKKDVWIPYGSELIANLGTYPENFDPTDAKTFDFNFLTCDKVTSGDFSFEAEVQAEKDRNVFCGLVFGRKAAETFHGLIFYPGWDADAATGRTKRPGYVDLATFYGGGESKPHRHSIVKSDRRGFHKMRVDVVGSAVDVWFDDVLLVSQEFDSEDVLRGAFGLITGRGGCRFRNVRLQPRDRADFGAKIERKIRLEKMEAEQGAGPRNGSWLSRVPPDPLVSEWVQGGGFTRFDELGAVPKLLVMWYIGGNESIRVDPLLQDLAKRMKPYGLEIISIVHWNDKAALAEYLKQRTFPGHVGLDRRLVSESGRPGDTFAAYSIKDNTPFCVLLDIDDVVQWDGDPGIAAGQIWKPGDTNYLEDQITQLAEKRKLKELKSWREAWNTTARPALEDGNFDAALPFLDSSLKLTARAAEVAEAQRFRSAIETTAADAERFADRLVVEKAEPCLKVLLDWASRIGHPVAKDVLARLQPVANSQLAKDWEIAIKKVDAAKAKLGKGDPAPVIATLRKELEPLSGPFVHELEDALATTTDPESVRSVLDGAKRIPARWLAGALATP